MKGRLLLGMAAWACFDAVVAAQAPALPAFSPLRPERRILQLGTPVSLTSTGMPPVASGSEQATGPVRLVSLGPSTSLQSDMVTASATVNLETNAPGVATTRACGQDPLPVPTSGDVYAAPYCNGFCDRSSAPDDRSSPLGRFWVRGEYLLWATNGIRLPALLTTSPQGTALASAGVLGANGTSVVFGDSREGGNMRSGARFTLGAWLDQSQTIGLEANYFFLANQSTNFAIASTGNPILAIPFTDVNPAAPGPGSFKTAFAGFVQGAYQASTYSHFGGSELNLRYNLFDGCNGKVDFLGGFRYLRLSEGVMLHDTEIAQGLAFPVQFDLIDRFETQNDFYGGQIGFMGEYWRGRWFMDFTGKVALGSNQRTINIDGVTNSIVVVPQAAQQGGLFALGTNSGTHRTSSLSVVPEVGINIGYQLSERVRLSVGYSLLCWTNVVRPGDQIDTTINTSQQPLGTGLVGSPRPLFNARNTDTLLVHGVNFALEFRY